MVIQPGAAEVHSSKPSAIFHPGRGQSVEVTPEGGYKIHLPWWQRLALRMMQNKQNDPQEPLAGLFTQKEMSHILRESHRQLDRLQKGKPLKDHKPSILSESGLLAPALHFIGLLDGAPSIVEGMDVWQARNSMRAHPEMFQMQGDKTPQSISLTPQQEAYIESAIQEKRIRSEDISALRKVLENANYRALVYQQQFGPIQIKKPLANENTDEEAWRKIQGNYPPSSELLEQAKAYVYRDPEIKKAIASNPERTNIEELVDKIRAVLPEADIAKTTQFPYYSKYYMVDPKTVHVLANHVLTQEVRAPDSQQPEDTRILTPNELAYLRLQIQNGISEEELGEATRILLSEKIHEGNFQNRKATM